MKRRKIGHAPSSIKARKSDMPYVELLNAIDYRLKALKDSEEIYMQDVIRFGGMINDTRSRIDEIESFRAWVVNTQLESGIKSEK